MRSTPASSRGAQGGTEGVDARAAGEKLERAQGKEEIHAQGSFREELDGDHGEPQRKAAAASIHGS
jgi:hypothetical protein